MYIKKFTHQSIMWAAQEKTLHVQSILINLLEQSNTTLLKQLTFPEESIAKSNSILIYEIIRNSSISTSVWTTIP